MCVIPVAPSAHAQVVASARLRALLITTVTSSTCFAGVLVKVYLSTCEQVSANFTQIFRAIPARFFVGIGKL